MARNDKSWDLLDGGIFSLASTGYIASSNVGAPPFVIIDMSGCNHLSLTLNNSGAAVGTVALECTDIGGYLANLYRNPQYFAPLYQPNTTTQYSLAINGANSVNIQIPNLGVHFVRLKYTSTSGTGNLTAWATCRAVK